MAVAKGLRWSDAEVECLLEIWADKGIQSQLDKSHRNSEVFAKIRDFLLCRGYGRSIDQCRDKVKKLRFQYMRVQDALRKSGCATDEKEKFQWYNAVDQIIGLKRYTEPKVLESASVLDCSTVDHDLGAPLSDEPASDSNTSSRAPTPTTTPTRTSTGTGTSTSAPSTTRKRKRKRMRTDVSEVMESFMEMQQKQHEEFMQAEQQRHQQEMEMFNRWMNTQREMEEHRQQETSEMLQLFTAMMPSHPQHSTPQDNNNKRIIVPH